MSRKHVENVFGRPFDEIRGTSEIKSRLICRALSYMFAPDYRSAVSEEGYFSGNVGSIQHESRVKFVVGFKESEELLNQTKEIGDDFISGCYDDDNYCAFYHRCMARLEDTYANELQKKFADVATEGNDGCYCDRRDVKEFIMNHPEVLGYGADIALESDISYDSDEEKMFNQTLLEYLARRIREETGIKDICYASNANLANRNNHREYDGVLCAGEENPSLIVIESKFKKPSNINPSQKAKFLEKVSVLENLVSAHNIDVFGIFLHPWHTDIEQESDLKIERDNVWETDLQKYSSAFARALKYPDEGIVQTRNLGFNSEFRKLKGDIESSQLEENLEEKLEELVQLAVNEWGLQEQSDPLRRIKEWLNRFS